jgi:hypothetical protein
MDKLRTLFGTPDKLYHSAGHLATRSMGKQMSFWEKLKNKK